MQVIAPWLHQIQNSQPFPALFPKVAGNCFRIETADGTPKSLLWATAMQMTGSSILWRSIRFFFLLIRGLMALGMRVEVAGVLINSLAFLGALLLVYFWVEERYDTGAAKRTSAVLAWCPFSLFCTVMYTEGLFLLLTAAAL